MPPAYPKTSSAAHASSISKNKMATKAKDTGTRTKRKHVTLTLPEKLDIIDRLEKGENRQSIMEKYNVGSSTIYDIKRKKDELRSFVSTSGTVSGLLERQTLKQPKFHQLDSVLYKWFTAMRSEGKPVSGPMIIEKAKSFYDEMKLTDKCTFSDGWLRNFKERHGIRKLDICGETLSANTEAARDYDEVFNNLVREHELSAAQIYNADETGLYWKCLPNSTLADSQEKSAKGFKLNKNRITVLVCANADGSHKLKLFVLGKFKKPRAFKNVVHLPVIYGSQQNAWMTAELFKDWFINHFVPAVKDNFKSKGLPEDTKAVLVLDNCRAHPQELVSGNIFVTYLPANVTSLIQPMDQGVIQNFKQNYRGSFVRKLVNSDCSVPDFQASFNLKDAIFAAALAWKDVKPRTLRRAWIKLWPGCMLLEDSSDEEFEGFTVPRSAKDILSILSRASVSNPVRKLTEDEVIGWVEVDKDVPVVQELSDEQLIQSVVNPELPQETEDQEEDEEPRQKYTWKEASDFITKFVEFAECSSYYTTAEVVDLHIILNNFHQKKSSSMKQADIRDMFKKKKSS